MKRTLYKAIMFSFCAALIPPVIHAQDQDQDQDKDKNQQDEQVIEEVIVTATKRSSTIQDVPFSINAQTEEDIQRSGATNLEELSRNVAGLSVQNLGPGQSQVAIRGVSAGQIVRDQPGVKEQVGVYLDESVISLSLFTPDLDLYDLNRVETLRGPQGTLFGAGSIGGTVRFITNQPNLDENEGSLETDFNNVTEGSFGGSFKGMVNAPFADNTAAVRAVGYYTRYGGYINALGEGGTVQKNVNDGYRAGGRVAVTWEPNDNISITPRIVVQKVNTDGFNRQEQFNLFANPNTTTRPPIQLGPREQYLLLNEGFNDRTTIADLTSKVFLDDLFDITYVGSYTDRNITVSRDASALTGSVSVDLGFPEEAVLLPSNLIDTTSVHQYTNELRFSSNSTGRLQWIFGAFQSHTKRNYAQRLPTPGYAAATDAALGAGTSAAVANGFPNLDSPFNSDLPFTIKEFGTFGEVTVDATDELHVTAGLRYYNHHEKRFITTGGLFAAGDFLTEDKTNSNGWAPRFMIAYDVSEDLTVNAQASRGFRVGGVNDPLNTGLCTADDLRIFGGFQDYSDETLWNFETGVKMRLGNGVTFNTAFFHSNIHDLQVTLDAGSCSSRISFNVASAHTTGAEFELAAQPLEGFDVTLSGSILNSEFDSTVRDGTGAIIGGVENGNRLPSVPTFQMSAGATYTFPGELISGADTYLSLTAQHVGDQITQPSDQVPGAGSFVSGLPFGGASGNDVTLVDLNLDAYTLLNASFGLVTDTWEAVLYVDNLTDKNADTSFDRERGGRAWLGFRTNTPRTIGVRYRYKY